MKKVIGYVRVSSEIQKLKDNSIKNQIEYISDYCLRYGYELIKIYEDNGVSGLKDDRDGLKLLLNDIKVGEIDIVIVYSLSRLGRRLKDVINYVELLNKKNIKFISIKENFNNDDVIGKLMLNILGSINEFEVNILSDRIKDIKQYKKSKNEVYCGNILYGMSRNGNKLIENLDELKNLKLIIQLKEKENWSYNKISNYLNRNNINSKEKCKWYGSSVRSVYLNGVKEKFLL